MQQITTIKNRHHKAPSSSTKICANSSDETTTTINPQQQQTQGYYHQPPTMKHKPNDQLPEFRHQQQRVAVTTATLSWNSSCGP